MMWCGVRSHDLISRPSLLCVVKRPLVEDRYIGVNEVFVRKSTIIPAKMGRLLTLLSLAALLCIGKCLDI